MFKKIRFEVSWMLLLGGIILALVIRRDELFDKVLYIFLFSLPLIGLLHRLVEILKGNDMSTNAMLKRAKE